MVNLDVLKPAVRAAWGPDTCDVAAREEWRPDNPARGQCGTTALVVHDLLGGDLILAEVHVDGVKVGHHYWNRLPDGTEIDLTDDQFRPGEVVAGGVVQHRPPDAPRRCREEYELLRHRVLSALSSPRPSGAGPVGEEGGAEAADLVDDHVGVAGAGDQAGPA
ncbi:hypothetical protein [Nonomuraea sp. WAC 01424]|uniref:YunG family protein n=1 Tax=Nonomuraea sp. WAC 01424 TaxID=2203200 RepID=UPI00163CB951|nr:hypothetical protein [Nonomuraea sp. WAC 01424]